MTRAMKPIICKVICKKTYNPRQPQTTLECENPIFINEIIEKDNCPDEKVVNQLGTYC
ncbi:MAG: hypothetical protein ABIM16_03255 [Ginsengibacter sp.]